MLDTRIVTILLGVIVTVGCSGAGSSTKDAVVGGDGAGDGDCVRRVLKAEVTNARDLGGHPLSTGKVACRKLLRGGDLTGLSQGCSEFAQLGIKGVIDLRQATVPPPTCVTDRAKVIAAPMPKLLPDTTANYLALMKEKQAVAAVFAALGDAQRYPAYIHCVIGRDRASFVTALVMQALGAGRKAVIDEFELSADAGVSVKTKCIEAVLDEVDKRGGIETYLGSCGVTAAQLATLRQQATKN